MCRGKFHKMLKINNLRAFLRPFLGWRLAVFCAFLVLAALVWVFQGRSPEAKAPSSCAEEAVWEPMGHSRLLHLGHRCGNGEIEVFSFIGKDTVVYRLTVEKPVRRVVILSSAQIGFMTRLGIADRIVGVGEGKYVVDSALYARVAAGEVAEVGNGPTISLEKVLALKPDLVMTFATGGSYDDYDRLIQLLDSTCGADGTQNLETRMNDVKQRYGHYPEGKWNKNFELKDYFEKLMGRDFYEVIR